jgi:hypothetical protein
MNAKTNDIQNYKNAFGNNALQSGGYVSTHMMMRYIFDRILNNSVKYNHQPTDFTQQMYVLSI